TLRSSDLNGLSDGSKLVRPFFGLGSNLCDWKTSAYRRIMDLFVLDEHSAFIPLRPRRLVCSHHRDCAHFFVTFADCSQPGIRPVEGANSCRYRSDHYSPSACSANRSYIRRK